MAEFFSTLPQVFVELWGFLEGFYGVAITVGSIVLAAGLLVLAVRWRDEKGWVSAILGVMGGTVAVWWLFGILPSAFLYFMDGQRDLLEGTLVPAALPGMENFYEVFRDAVVGAQTVIGVVIVVVIALAVQKRYPRALAEGEEPRQQSGGYR